MIATIENAIVERIESASALGILGYTLKKVETYGGQLDDDYHVRMIINSLPAVYVVNLSEKQTKDIGGGKYQFEGRFAVMVCARNARNEAATRHGAGANEVGTYQICRDVRTLLADQTLGLGHGYLVPEGAKPLFNGMIEKNKLSLRSLEFSMRWVEGSAPSMHNLPAQLTPELLKNAEYKTPEGVLAESTHPRAFEALIAEWLSPTCGNICGTSVIQCKE